MRNVILLSLLAFVVYVQVAAHPRGDEATSTLESIGRSIASRKPNVQPARRRRFKTKPSRHGANYYQRMIGLRTSPAYWKRPVRGNIYNALKNVSTLAQLPKEFRWTSKPNIVSSVKHQGGCGSSYSFAALGAIESMLAIWNKKPNLDLSEQEIIDCSQRSGNFGCNGGLIENVLQWVVANKGLTLENVYPYKGIAGKCRQPTKPNYAAGMTYAQIPPGNEDGLRSVVYYLGPVGIGIHANLTSFFNYTEGIYDAEECNTDEARVDHAVLLVGWGEKDGAPYWLIKNSWGTEWGENGFAKILRGTGQCKIGRVAFVPIFEWVAKKLLNRKVVRYHIK